MGTVRSDDDVVSINRAGSATVGLSRADGEGSLDDVEAAECVVWGGRRVSTGNGDDKDEVFQFTLA